MVDEANFPCTIDLTMGETAVLRLFYYTVNQ